MPPRKSAQRTSRKRQRHSCQEDKNLEPPVKQQSRDENASPAHVRKKATQQPLQAHSPGAKECNVLCRQEEVSRLELTLLKCIRDEQGTAIYVPGQPGTGKTHTVRSVVSSLGAHGSEGPLPTCTLVNCQDASSSLPRVCLAGLREANAVMNKFNSRGEFFNYPCHSLHALGRISYYSLPVTYAGSALLPIVAGDACKMPSACSNAEASNDLKKLVSGSKKSTKVNVVC